MTLEQAYEALGVAPGSAVEVARAAYLEGVREYPPERCPRDFERLRDAWEVLRDPGRHQARALASDVARVQFADLVSGTGPVHLGPGPWLSLLRGGE